LINESSWQGRLDELAVRAYEQDRFGTVTPGATRSFKYEGGIGTTLYPDAMRQMFQLAGQDEPHLDGNEIDMKAGYTITIHRPGRIGNYTSGERNVKHILTYIEGDASEMVIVHHQASTVRMAITGSPEWFRSKLVRTGENDIGYDEFVADRCKQTGNDLTLYGIVDTHLIVYLPTRSLVKLLPRETIEDHPGVFMAAVTWNFTEKPDLRWVANEIFDPPVATDTDLEQLHFEADPSHYNMVYAKDLRIGDVVIYWDEVSPQTEGVGYNGLGLVVESTDNSIYFIRVGIGGTETFDQDYDVLAENYDAIMKKVQHMQRQRTMEHRAPMGRLGYIQQIAADLLLPNAGSDVCVRQHIIPWTVIGNLDNPPVATDIDVDELMFASWASQGVHYEMEAFLDDIDRHVVVYLKDQFSNVYIFQIIWYMDEGDIEYEWFLHDEKEETSVYISPQNVPDHIQNAMDSLFSRAHSWVTTCKPPDKREGVIKAPPPVTTDIDVEELMFSSDGISYDMEIGHGKYVAYADIYFWWPNGTYDYWHFWSRWQINDGELDRGWYRWVDGEKTEMTIVPDVIVRACDKLLPSIATWVSEGCVKTAMPALGGVIMPDPPVATDIDVEELMFNASKWKYSMFSSSGSSVRYTVINIQYTDDPRWWEMEVAYSIDDNEHMYNKWYYGEDYRDTDAKVIEDKEVPEDIRHIADQHIDMLLHWAETGEEPDITSGTVPGDPPVATDIDINELLFSALSPGAQSSFLRARQSPRGKPHPHNSSPLDTRSSDTRIKGSLHEVARSGSSPDARPSDTRIRQSPHEIPRSALGKPHLPAKPTGKTTPPQNYGSLYDEDEIIDSCYRFLTAMNNHIEDYSKGRCTCSGFSVNAVMTLQSPVADDIMNANLVGASVRFIGLQFFVGTHRNKPSNTWTSDYVERFISQFYTSYKDYYPDMCRDPPVATDIDVEELMFNTATIEGIETLGNNVVGTITLLIAKVSNFEMNDQDFRHQIKTLFNTQAVNNFLRYLRTDYKNDHRIRSRYVKLARLIDKYRHEDGWQPKGPFSAEWMFEYEFRKIQRMFDTNNLPPIATDISADELMFE